MSISLGSQLNRSYRKPIDPNLYFETLNEALALSEWTNKFYKNCIITVYNDSVENNGLWMLKEDPYPNENENKLHQDINNWSKIATLDEIPEGKYTNTSIVPENIGDFKAGEPATPAEGMTIPEVIDKILFKYIPPVFDLTLSNTQSTWKGEEFIVNVTYDVTFNASNAGFAEMHIEYKENNEANWKSFKSAQSGILNSDDYTFNVGGAQSETTNNGSTLDSLEFRFRFTDKYGEEYSIEKNVNLASYDKPDVQWIINAANPNPIRNDIVGTIIDFDIGIVNNSINAPLSSSALSVVTTSTSTPFTPTDSSSDNINYATRTFEPDVNDFDIDFNLTVTDSKKINTYNQPIRLYDYYFIKTTGTSYLTDANKYDNDNIIKKINTSDEITENVVVNGTHISLILPIGKTLTYAQTENGENLVFTSDTISIEVGGGKTKTYNIWKCYVAAGFTGLSLTLKFN